ncbi:hypothetical protein [Paraburkholderia sp. BL25I1N1]|uniref:hypothetical protein n=1 Tax=Paraburkholderia sp. BL25I1N1 TaxID=1938804 RepID=UPI0011B1E28D|nr:hypothetical protein [Paraburkholderia sp. BL25I1N1]
MNKSQRKGIPSPAGWGDDALSHFQEAASLNEQAMFVHAPAWHKALSNIASDLSRCTGYAMSTLLNVGDPASRLLYASAHNQYLAAARMASSGQALAAYPLGRATVESSLYGWYLESDRDAAARWHNKPTDRKLLGVWSNEFKFSTLAAKLTQTHSDGVQWAKWLHQTAIDFGGHPNKEGVYANMDSQRADDGSTKLQMKFLHDWNAASLLANKFVIEAGMFTLSLFAMSFPDADAALKIRNATAAHALALRSLVDSSGAIMKRDGA